MFVPAAGSLTSLGVEAAGVEEVRREDNVHVTEEEKHIAPLPSPSANVQPAASGEFFIQLDQCKVLEVHLPE